MAHLPVKHTIRSRNGCRYFTLRSWKAECKDDQVTTLRLLKGDVPRSMTRAVAAEMTSFIRSVLGQSEKLIVTSVPSGHSRRPDSLASMVAQRVANNLRVNYVRLWQDRPVPGTSFPRPADERSKLEWVVVPKLPVVVIDDVVTSGSHMEECLMSARSVGVSAVGLGWIGGTSRGGLT